MSKNTLKKAQQRREKKKSEESEPDRSTDDPVKDALLDAEARDEKPTKRLNAEIPSRLHERFKAACKSEGKSMTDVVVQLVETYVDLK